MKQANDSEGTFDSVIYNRGDVLKMTAVKIQEILENCNFSINPVASALALKRNIK